MSDRDPLQTLWAKQPAEPFTMTLADVHARAARFRSKIRVRNITEYAAAAFVIGVFGWMAVLIPVLMVKAGAALIILGALYVCWQLHALAGAPAKSELDAAASVTDFHSAELQRQRAALAAVWQWYLAPFVPGMLVFVGGVAFAPELEMPLMGRLSLFATTAAPIAGIFAVIAWLNARAVQALDKEIAVLESVKEANS